MPTKNQLNARKELIQALRGIEISAWIIQGPADLVLRFWCDRHHDYCWMLVSNLIHDHEFCRETNTPMAKTFDEVRHAINLRHAIGSIVLPPVLQPRGDL